MSYTLTCDTARLLVVAPPVRVPDGSVSVQLVYSLCRTLGDGTVLDVVDGRSDQSFMAAFAANATFPTDAQIAQLLRADCVAKFGGTVEHVIVNGVAY